VLQGSTELLITLRISAEAFCCSIASSRSRGRTSVSIGCGSRSRAVALRPADDKDKKIALLTTVREQGGVVQGFTAVFVFPPKDFYTYPAAARG